jgi:signal transduction histidine kinase
MTHLVRDRLRVLLVEDNPGDVDLVREHLADARTPPRVELEHAERVADAVARLGGGGIDAVLLDLSLPDARGLEALHRMRAAAPAVPVVVLTGAEDAVGEQAMNEGAQDYLRKGDVHGHLLRRALRYAIQRQSFVDRERLLKQEHDARLSAEEAVRARDEFISIAAHELRTPLAALQLQVTQLERRARAAADDPDCGTCADKLGRAMRQLDRLKRLVSTLLDVTRITGAGLAVERDEIDLVSVARRAVDEFACAAAAAGSTITVDASGPVVGAWDASGLDQILMNLLENAIKYGGGHAIELAVRAQGGTAVLTVRDGGIGIAAEHVARIFERFERAVSVRNYGGLGLGLFIVRHIAEAHGGTVAVESRPGDGSTFTVRLPLSGAPATA